MVFVTYGHVNGPKVTVGQGACYLGIVVDISVVKGLIKT